MANTFDPKVWAAVPFHFWSLTVFAFGCMVGSFLNVCIYRMPRGLSVISPPSHCPECGYSMNGLDNSACPECGRRYTLDELIGLQGYDGVRKLEGQEDQTAPDQAIPENLPQIALPAGGPGREIGA